MTESVAPAATASSEAPVNQENGRQPEQRHEKIKLKEINNYITCFLCKGYLIDATTISECLHSFCRSCIIRFLDENSYCPVCEVIINKAKPNLKPDKTLQDIVYKLVPGLFLDEMLRRRRFYAGQPPGLAQKVSPELRGEDTERTIFNPQDRISLSLEYIGDSSKPPSFLLKQSIDRNQKHDKGDEEAQENLLRRYLQCPGMCRVDVMKKFVRNKYNVDTDLYNIDILYKRVPVPLPDHYTLIDVAYIYTWKRNEPMKFFFRIVEKERAGDDLEPPVLEKVFKVGEGVAAISRTPKPSEIRSAKRSEERKRQRAARRAVKKVLVENTETADEKKPVTIEPPPPDVAENRESEFDPKNDNSDSGIDVLPHDDKPEEPEIKPAEPKTKPEELNAKSEDPKTKPEEPKTKPEEPKTKPEERKAKLEEPKMKPEEHEAKLEEPKTKPEERKAKSEESKTKPEKYKAKLEEPKTKPEERKAKPEKPKTKPEERKAKPEEPKTKPEEPKTKPEERKMKPEDRKTKLEERKTKPEEPKAKPEEIKAKKEEPKEKESKAKQELNVKPEINKPVVETPKVPPVSIVREQASDRAPQYKIVSLKGDTDLESAKREFLKAIELTPKDVVEALARQQRQQAAPKEPKATKRKNSSPVKWSDQTKRPKTEKRPVKIILQQKPDNGNIEKLLKQIPSSLSITLQENDQPARKPPSSVQNYIEILKLPDDAESSKDAKLGSSFQKIFEESIKKTDDDPPPNGILKNVTKIAPKLTIPRPKELKEPKEQKLQSVSNLHSTSLGLNYTVSVGQTPNRPSKIAAALPPFPPSSSDSSSSPKRPRFADASLARMSPLTANQLLEKYNIQNLAQMTASGQLAAFHQAMLLKQIEYNNFQKWMSANSGPLMQFENYLKSVNGAKNPLVSNVKEN